MAHETSKCLSRRLHDNRFITKYFVGDGIDIGSGQDELAFYGSLFPLMRTCRNWDLIQGDGDGALLEGIEDESLDFVHASHCLEHMDDPLIALNNWIRVLRPGGHVIFTVPDEDIFEQGVWPSGPAGAAHKTSWTIAKPVTWAPNSINMIAFLSVFLEDVFIIKIELIDRMYLYEKDIFDQTTLPCASECAIEVILRKKTKKQKMLGGVLDERHLRMAADVKNERENKYKEAITKKEVKWAEQENQSTSETIKAVENNGSSTA